MMMTIVISLHVLINDSFGMCLIKLWEASTNDARSCNG